MKKFLWLSTTALVLICLICWRLSYVIPGSLQNLDLNVPAPTLAVLRYNLLFLFLPIPWIVYLAMLNKQRQLTLKAVFAFTGTLFLATFVLACIAMVAFISPLFPMQVPMK
jgi:hypothetical protein